MTGEIPLEEPMYSVLVASDPALLTQVAHRQPFIQLQCRKRWAREASVFCKQMGEARELCIPVTASGGLKKWSPILWCSSQAEWSVLENRPEAGASCQVYNHFFLNLEA